MDVVSFFAGVLAAASFFGGAHPNIVVAAYSGAPREGQTCGVRRPGAGYGYHDELPPLVAGDAPPRVVNINELYLPMTPQPTRTVAGLISLTRLGWYLEDDRQRLYFVPDTDDATGLRPPPVRATLVTVRDGKRLVPAHAVPLRPHEILAVCWNDLGYLPTDRPVSKP